MKRLVQLCTVVAFLLPAIPTQAGECGPGPDPLWPVCGYVTKITHTGQVDPPNAYFVKFCRTDNGACYSTMTVAQGSTKAFSFQGLTNGDPNTHVQYNVFAWGYFENWGSSTVPMDTISLSGTGLVRYHLAVPPAPFSPGTIYPNNGATDVPNQYLVQWNSGIDIDRAVYPANWEIWFKYWPIGDAEPTYWSLARSNMPCHDNGSGPDASGNCSTYVAGPQPAGHWKWFVRVNLNVAGDLFWYMPHPTYFTADSSPAEFIGVP